MLRFTRNLVVVGLTLALAACIPEFANPIVGGNKADPALIGAWTGKAADDSESMPMEITAEGDGIALVLKEPKPSEGSSGDMRFTGTSAEVGGVHYVNLRPVSDDVPAEYGQMIFKYEVKGEEIHVWSLDEKAIAAAIDSGKLKGTTTGAGSDTTPKVSSSGDEVAAWLATDEGKSAFASGTGDVLILTRAKP